MTKYIVQTRDYGGYGWEPVVTTESIVEANNMFQEILDEDEQDVRVVAVLAENIKGERKTYDLCSIYGIQPGFDCPASLPGRP